MSDKIEIRELDAGDRAAWDPLWQGYLTFYEKPLPTIVTDTVWARFHDPAESVFALGAFLHGDLVGIVHYLFHRATWSVADRCYLEDLFVTPTARGHGAGRALITAVIDKARAEGSERVYWHTHESNRTARALYDKMAENAGFVQYRVKP
jgi:GNAT superfamily N-acetyltransferase